MAPPNWLEFRSGAPHFHGPVLLEYTRAYEFLGEYTFSPRVVLAIGAQAKRSFLRDHDIEVGESAIAGVALRRFSPSTVLVDCELHNAVAFKSRKAGPLLGNCMQHPLPVPLTVNSPQHKISVVVQDLYWQMLFPFASIILFFVDDLGGTGPALELLARWVRKSLSSPSPCPPRILIVYDWQSKISVQQFDRQLRARLTAFLNGVSSSKTELHCRAAFESIQLFPSLTSLHKLSINIEEAFSMRDRAGFAFSSEHLHHLLQLSVRQSSQSIGQQFDCQLAVRLQTPPSPKLAEHISRFILASQSVDLDYESVVASTLQLDAYPPGMHCQ